MPGAVSVIPNLAHFPSARAGGSLPSSTGPLERQPPSEGGVSFDAPAQVTTLQNANKVGQAVAVVPQASIRKPVKH